MAKAKKAKGEVEFIKELEEARDLAREIINFLDGRDVEEPDKALTIALGTVLGAMYPQEEAWKITTDYVLKLARNTREIINAQRDKANAEA